MEVTLSRGSWHYRVQTFVFGEVPFKNNFCPYFWLTLFCLLVFPFVYLYKVALGKVVRFVYNITLAPLFKLGDMFVSFIENNLCDPLIRWSYQRMPVDDVVEIYIANEYNWDSSKRKRRLLRLWMKYTDNAEALLKEAEKIFWRRRSERLEEEEARARLYRKRREKLEQKSKDLYQRIIKYTKWIVTGMAFVLAVGVVLGVCWCIGWLITNLTVAVTLSTAKFLGACIVAALTLVGTVFAIYKGVRCIATIRFPTARFTREGIKLPGGKVWRGIGEFFVFLWIFVKNFKKNHCPHIEWEDSACQKE